MNRLILFLLMILITGSALGQSPIFFRSPPVGYDAVRDPAVGERIVLNDATKASANTTAWNALNDKVHMSSGGIANDVVIRPGRLYHDGTLRIGVNAAKTQIRAGGAIIGTGGYGAELNSNSTSVNLGCETRIINTNQADSNSDSFADGASLLYGGFGWRFGNCSIYGFDIPQHNPGWTNRDSDTAPRLKQDVGLLLEDHAILGPEEASFLYVAPITFMGFNDAIRIQPEGAVEGVPSSFQGQANNTYWSFIHADTCNTVFHVNDDQSVAHEIYALSPGQYVDRSIFMERGGHIHVHTMEVIYPNHTVAEFGNHYNHQHGDLRIDGLKLDNKATSGTIVLKLGTKQSGQHRPVSITGSVGNAVGFHGSGAVQGVDADDRVFLRFTGDPTKAAIINDFSTVDADGNYRRKNYSLQVTPLGSNLTVDDGKAYFRVPAELNGWRLEFCHASLAVASSNGIPTFQLRRKRSGSDVDMFSTRVTIDQGETDTAGAENAQEINTSNDDVATGDRIYFDCDVAGTGAQGYQAFLTFRRW